MNRKQSFLLYLIIVNCRIIFAVRCAESDKKFIFAMVKCEELPCTISNVAKTLKKEVIAISTTRAQLINKGIIYPVRYKELDFTVPEFSGYIRRLDEYKEWCEEIG